ncbi:hypothetical protein EO98_02710 [Methanosarcina sp. 2.H.T.1A.6]|uniref:hypothetical protein n=1 Tax=unclassified Methanosarcina TaxID=2644672 RepID=UPI0006216CF6|nr:MULTISPECIES: hypothetical protein [unclassified Methanosarcina]KKG09788.1 hypothetical protein EO97_14565 [Methanosarcina sp. 2.H.T.1A.15]KKG18483.1 hypothetical protein EO94_04735 [Methanosarcina sp. 2.H.T.1A.3]KKG21138.1 hypothetical protein EO96_01240 [Methanosarcina sp. 2.H.T.1A.8]KKG22348.1 hypothetical protein EO98_02710 [Methanosarcina sp. 2.H.T.1A.6]
MKTRYKIIVLLIIISAVLLSIWWQEQKERIYERNHMSSYDYRIELTTDSTLSNFTLYLPLPVINNTSPVGTDIAENHFNDYDRSWKYALVDTEHGLMLSINNEKIEPKYATRSRDSKKILHPSIFSMTLFTNQTIDTMNPLGNEMVLMPKYNLTQNVTRRPYPPASEIFDYESKMYAHYDTSSNANVSISIYLHGSNGWWIGGWLYNSYWENMGIKLSGPQAGWTTVNGQLFTGEGTYY